MGVDRDKSATATAMLAGMEHATPDDASPRSPFRPGRRPANELASSSAAALPSRIGAPRSSRPRTVAPETTAAAEVADGRRRTREPRGAAPAPASPATQVAVDRPSRIRSPHDHDFSGTVSVTVGPFGDLDPIAAFAHTLSSIRGVASVRIRTFDRASVVFDVDLAEPTALIARLRGRSPQLLRLLYANDRIIRLKIV